MPLIKVELIDFQQAEDLNQQIDRATTVEELRAVVRLLIEHLRRIEYIGEPE